MSVNVLEKSLSVEVYLHERVKKTVHMIHYTCAGTCVRGGGCRLSPPPVDEGFLARYHSKDSDLSVLRTNTSLEHLRNVSLQEPRRNRECTEIGLGYLPELISLMAGGDRKDKGNMIMRIMECPIQVGVAFQSKSTL